MAKSPLAKEPPAAKRADRHTRITTGPGPVPPPVSSSPSPPRIPDIEGRGTSRRPEIKKTQVLMGAPPIPPSVSGKPEGAAEAPRLIATPPAVATDWLPSTQETAVGDASSVPQAVPSTRSDEVMAKMMEGGLFGNSSDFHEDQVTGLHRPADPASRSGSSIPKPPPPRPVSGPAPRASSNLRDTMPTAELRNPSGAHPVASGETHADIDGSPDAADRRATDDGATPRDPDRRAPTAMRVTGSGGIAAPLPDAPRVRLVPGKVIPGTRYKISRWLGEGGMGVVYEVTHTDIERRSALKVLRFDLSHQPQMAQVFRDEARAASRLRSPHIVEVYDFGELPDGRLFFAMELLEGQDLVPADEKTSMDPSRLIGILRQVCKGLAKAHDANVVHRDVKPENILVLDEGENQGRADCVKLVDFGISAILAAGKKRAGIAGTPHYMAPEQVLGEEFDGRLDIYALGCTAFELMAGKPPFDAEEVEDLLKLQVNATPPSPSELRPELKFPAQLEAVIMRCLAKKPDERYADMADLEAALCEAQIAAGITTAWDDLPVPALPDTERYERIVARMPSPHDGPIAKRAWFWPLVAGTSTLAAAGLAGYLLFGRQPTAEEQDLVEQLTIEARDAASKTAWVVPPPHVEGDTTALRKIVELESVEGRAEALADARAEELRHEFAMTLMGHGDLLWDEARGIARQYYMWTLAFEDNDHALERANLDLLTLNDLRQHAAKGSFNKADRLIAGAALMRVVDDPEQMEAMTTAVQAGLDDPDSVSLSLRAQIERQAESAGMRLRRPKRGSGLAGSGRGRQPPRTPPVAEPPPEDDDELVVDPAEETEAAANPGRRKRRRQVDVGLDGRRVKSDPARSKELTKQADAKRQQGLRAEAKNLYGQAIAANPKNGAAHLGLAQVHFDLSSYDKARKSALQAVKYAPRNGRARKLLGDSYYKAFRYPEAEQAYQEAQRLGVNVGKRLADVRKKLGK